ncbi:MAG: PCRF domain-containing protein, partial [Lachnospiraceae bacterium]|nr:PCRF domain-containing protein [Lachnospiraceae bacterium]
MLIELEQYKYDMSQYEKPLDEIKVSLKVDEKSEELKTLEQEMGAPDFWNDNDKAQKVVKRVNKLKSVVASYQGLKTDYEDILTMMDMADEEDDASMVPDIEEMISDFNKRFEEIRNKTFLSGEYDSESAIVTLHAGAGGTESCDWCSMLYRMYT